VLLPLSLSPSKVAAVALRVLVGAVLKAGVQSQSLRSFLAPLRVVAPTLIKFSTRAKTRGVFVATGSSLFASTRLATKGVALAAVGALGAAVALGAVAKKIRQQPNSSNDGSSNEEGEPAHAGSS
jgi:hypothetical protein